MNEPKPPELDNEEQEALTELNDEEEKVARKWVTQSLIQWMPMGSSSDILASFLLKQDWAMALLMFPVMIITIGWAAWSESFLNQLRKEYQKKGKQDFLDVKNWLEKTDKAVKQAIKWQIARTEEKYLRYQGNDCEEYTTEGFKSLSDRIFIPMLDVDWGTDERISSNDFYPHISTCWIW